MYNPTCGTALYILIHVTYIHVIYITRFVKRKKNSHIQDENSINLFNKINYFFLFNLEERILRTS